MQTKEEVHELIEELRKNLPSFYSIPVSSDEEAKFLNEKKIIGAIVIQDGKFKDHIIILRNIEFSGSHLVIDYSAVDAEKRNIESEELNTVVGDLVNYFLALEKLKEFNNENNTNENNTNENKDNV